MRQRTDPQVRRRRNRLLIGFCAVACFAGSFGAPALTASANADTVLSQHVYNTNGLGLYLHPDSPIVSSATNELMPDGTEFDVSCFAVGDDVNGDNVWDFGTDAATGNTGYAADYYIDTPVSQGLEADQLSGMGVPQCGAYQTPSASSPSAPSITSYGPATVTYDRTAATQWAQDNLNTPPSFPVDDCTWYVSQALWAGGLPQSDLWTGDSWNWSLKASRAHFPGPTADAANANDLVNYLVSTGMATRVPLQWTDNTAGGAEPGDIIAYHWNSGEDPNQIDHLAFVHDLNDSGYPNVLQHTPARYRFWSWDPDNNGWVQQKDRPDGQDPGVWLIHINDGPTF